MTEQAPPEYLPFNGIQFNPAYYEQDIDNNITEYEANNTYLKKPINQNTGLINSVLTLTNTTTKEMQWTTPAAVITNYVNYDNVNKNLISNVSGTPSTITDLVISASIGSSTAQKFKLPTSTPSFIGSSLQVSSLSPLQTEWSIPQAIDPYVSYDATAQKLENNTAFGTSYITDLIVSSSLTSGTLSSTNTTITGTLGVSGLSSLNGGVSTTTLTSSTLNGLTSQGLIVKNGTTTNASLNNLGVLDCKSITNSGTLTSTNTTITGTIGVSGLSTLTGGINTQNSDVNCGTGSITCHTITASSNLVSTGGIIVYNGTNNTATVQQDGQITCKNFLIRQPGTNNYPLSISGTGDVLGNGADFSRLQTIELNIFNTLSAGVFGTLQASINNAGLLTCKGVNAGSSIIQTLSGVNCQYTDISGIMYSRGIEIRNALNTASLTVNTNGNLNTPGNINCALIDVGNTVYCRYLGVRDVGNTLDIIKLNQNGTIDCNIVKSTFVQCPFYESNPTDSGSIDIGIFNTTGNINIAQNNTTGNINIGNGGLIGVSQKIVFKRPLTIQYLIPSDYTYIGGTQAVTNFSLAVPNNTIKTIGTLTNVPGGNYMIFYSVEYTFLLSTKTFTLQQYGITSTLDSFSTIYGKCYDLETTSQIRTANVGGNSRFTKTFSNLITVIGTTSNIRLTVGLSYNTTENVTVNGSIKLMRIG